ncbi:uncharacterized protein MJAP1_002718 [Malassezia japonica]|uniref:Autophagy-related protein 16 domain-containing protein n=1 Tax=Malassezia japonica TaxID=223818 RepID=A0AAF0F381_9BASI|nr:uncharacterized protein MJAP1_002718 [Malassezia japonica]WFD39737.1 hypothetical protein MJAP1_002718 [Malassezia japonica]
MARAGNVLRAPRMEVEAIADRLAQRDARERAWLPFVAEFHAATDYVQRQGHAFRPRRGGEGHDALAQLEHQVSDLRMENVELRRSHTAQTQSAAEAAYTLHRHQREHEKTRDTARVQHTQLTDLRALLEAKNEAIEHLQDELATQTLELDMLTRQNKELRTENTSLLDRFLALKSALADEMNRATAHAPP